MTPIDYPKITRLSRGLFGLLVGRQRDDQRLNTATNSGGFFLEQFDSGGFVGELCFEGCIFSLHFVVGLHKAGDGGFKFVKLVVHLLPRLSIRKKQICARKKRLPANFATQNGCLRGFLRGKTNSVETEHVRHGKKPVGLVFQEARRGYGTLCVSGP